MDDKKLDGKLGIIAYGSLIAEPGDELEQYISDKVPCLTPFKVEYGRISSTRGDAPTLIPSDKGGQVSAVILVLNDELDLDEAKSMLWRRETRKAKGIYKHRENPSVNTVVVKTIEHYHGFDRVLFTSIGSNINGKITAQKLSAYAIESILSFAGRNKKDGIRYLNNAINAGITTPLTSSYVNAILEATQATSLEDAIATLDNRRILEVFDKYLNPHGRDHLAIATAINASDLFYDKVQVYAIEYGLLGSRGRIFTKDAEGNENEKVFCNCSTCRNSDEDFGSKYQDYEKLLKEEFDELSNVVHSSLPYVTKLAIWDAIFDGHPSLNYEFYGQEHRLQLDPAQAADIEQENRFNYQKQLKRYYHEPSSIPKYVGKDFETRKLEYTSKHKSALYPNELKDKVIAGIRGNQENLRDRQSNHFFEHLIDGESINLSTRVFNYQDIFSLVAATEEYNFLKFIEQYPAASSQPTSAAMTIEKTVLPIHFEDRSGREFERLVFAFLNGQKQWQSLEWLGEAGDDDGRDLWGVFQSESCCYQCANYRNLPLAKVTADIDKLRNENLIPQYFTVICGGKVSNKTREAIKLYAKNAGIQHTEVWSGPELEERLRTKAPELIERFVNGVEFPKNSHTDKDILASFAGCLDRPAFTTTFRNEINIPDFEKAITDTIEVFNTGVHRLRDGTIIRRFQSRHQIKDAGTKKKLAAVYDLVVDLRNTFTTLKKKEEIRSCGCGNKDCDVFILTDKACKAMDDLRNQILTSFSELVPDFHVRIQH